MITMVPQTGILLVNTGSPDSTSVPDVRRYLAQFLMDPDVIDVPLWLRFLIVYGGILPFRPQKSGENYQKIWTKNGSPLVDLSRQLAVQLSTHVRIPVEVGMRYQNPSIESGICELQRQGQLKRLVVVPLYPQYASSTTRSVQKEIKRVCQKIKFTGEVMIVPPFYNHPAFIQAWGSIIPTISGSHLLMSFHGVPIRHLTKTDPTQCHCMAVSHCCQTPSPAHATCYRAQCLHTADSIAKRLGISTDNYSVSFQSRLGKDPWLTPDTESEVTRLAKSGIRSLVVISPAFVTDCLETLEEIDIQARHTFLSSGGAEFTYIPSLNVNPEWISALSEIIAPFLQYGKTNSDIHVMGSGTHDIKHA